MTVVLTPASTNQSQPPSPRRHDSALTYPVSKSGGPQSKHKASQTGGALLLLRQDALAVDVGECVPLTFLLGEESLPLCLHIHAEGGGKELVHFQPPVKSNMTGRSPSASICVHNKAMLGHKK